MPPLALVVGSRGTSVVGAAVVGIPVVVDVAGGGAAVGGGMGVI